MADGENDDVAEQDKALEELNGVRAAACDNILDTWVDSQPEAVRQEAIDRYVAEGDEDAAIPGMSVADTKLIRDAFTHHIDTTIIKPLGLTLDQWTSYIDEADLPSFRQDIVNGDWEALRTHAKTVADYIKLHGDVNAL